MEWACRDLIRVRLKRYIFQISEFSDRSVFVKWSTPEGRPGTIFVSPGYHQGPCKTRLGLEVTVCWETVSGRVVKAVHSTGGCALQKIIKAGGGTKFLAVSNPLVYDKNYPESKQNKISVVSRHGKKTNKQKTMGTGGSG